MAKKMSSEFTSIKDKMQKLAEADAKAKEQAKERAAKKKELAAQLAALKKEREQQLATVFGTVFVKLYGNKVDTVFAKHITRGNVPTVAAVEQFFKKAHFDFSELPAEQEAKAEEKASVPSELHPTENKPVEQPKTAEPMRQEQAVTNSVPQNNATQQPQGYNRQYNNGYNNQQWNR